MTGKATLIIAVIGLLTVLNGTIVNAYIDGTVSHTESIFQIDSGRHSCRMCHLGFPTGGATVANYVFEGYRCLACHTGINTTHPLVDNLTLSSHRQLLCTNCHDIAHAGHGWYTSNPTQDIYGCYGRNCHQTLAARLEPPGDQVANKWVYAYYSGERASKTWNITSSIIFTSMPYFREIYPYSFVDPFNKSIDYPVQGRLYESCLKCHFTSPGTIQTGRTSYTVSHGDNCYGCHSSSLASPVYNVSAHSVSKTVNGTIYCSRCHTSVAGEVGSSVHSALSCSNCHGTLHIAGFNMTGSWLIIYYPSQGPITVPTYQQVMDGRRVFYYSQDNTSVYDIPVRPITRGTGYTLVTPVYTLRADASIVSQTGDRNITCFNCHFVGWNDPTVALFEIEWNVTGLHDPHTIQASITVNGYDEDSGGDDPVRTGVLLSFAVVAVLALLVVVVKRAGHGGGSPG